MARSTAIPLYDVPLEVRLVDNELVVFGPDGFCGSFSRQAALDSARRILALLGEDQPEADGGSS